MKGYKLLAIFQLLAVALYLIFGKEGAFDWRIALLILAMVNYIVYNEQRLKRMVRYYHLVHNREDGISMNSWKDIKIEGVNKIDKFVAEFDIWAIKKVPFAKFKVKIYEGCDGKYTGYTNIRIKNKIDGSPEGGIGFGLNVAEALQDTIKYFMEQINLIGGELTENDIEYSDPNDF